MAVIVLKHAEKYAGTHAERLAMDVSRVSLGSTFFEWDTSELFTFSPTGWVDKIGQVAGSMQLSGSKMRTVDSIMGTFEVSTSAVAKTIADKNATVHILSGNCWINPLATAVADATAIKLLSGMVLDLRVAATLSLISDATGASVQIIVWED